MVVPDNLILVKLCQVWIAEQKVFFYNIIDSQDEKTRPSQDVPGRVISQTVRKIRVRNFKGIRKLALKLSYQTLSRITHSISKL